MIINRNIKQKFSTFLNVEEQSRGLRIRISHLQTRFQLARNINSILESNPDGTVEYFAKTFVKELHKNNHIKLYAEHLSAYLEEPCFWLARRELSHQLEPLKYSELDCFQEARKVAAQPISIYEKYNFTDSNPSTWAKMQIKNKVKETAYSGRELCKYATWSLPKYLSENKLKEALKIKLGIKAKKEIYSYIFALRSYKAIYQTNQLKKNKGNLPEPNQAQWLEIEKYYNFQCNEYNEKLAANESERLEEIDNFQLIRKKICTCEKIVKDYMCKVEDVDINSPETIDSNETEIIVFNPEEKEIETEESQQIISICLFEFSKLSPECQKIIQLFYGLEISQTEMTEIFGLKQYKISRKIKQSEQNILKGLVKWSQVNLGISPNEGIIKEQNQPFKEWLKDYLKQDFYQILQENFLEQHQKQIMMLRLYYGEQLEMEIIAKKLNISPQEVAEKIAIVKQNIEIFLQEWVKEKMNISLPNSVNKRIVSFVEEWLKDAPYAMWS